MSELAAKTPKESCAEQVQILTQSTMNGNNRLFGGKLMEWIDIVAAVTARRHANRNVTTALVDTLEFRSPAKANDLIVLFGKIVYAGRTSMEICVKSYVERLSGKRELINSAYVVLVAIDEDGNPCPVPPLIPETSEECAQYEAAKHRRETRKRKREAAQAE